LITIIDYKMGNLGSIKNMFKYLGIESKIESDPDKIINASKILLPGVGSFKKAMANLDKGGFLPILEKKIINEKTPIMGICLGMQLLFETSEEGNCNGLGFIKGDVVRFNFNDENRKFNIPHMGWNIVKMKKDSLLSQNMYNENKFYFVHSYHAQCKDNEDVLMSTNYGYEFVSGIEKDNIFGFQFHPEKSHKYGKKLFENFINL
jgi:imidazole glycerol-phosphate synthase subunit HisH